MIFLFCHLRCSLVPTISDMKSLISSLAICSNTSVVGPDKNDQVQAALIVSPSCIISTIVLNKKFKPFEEPTPVTVPLFISSKILSRRTKMFKEKFVNSETLHVTIHDFQRKSFNKILRCSKISKHLAKSFEVNKYLKRLISKQCSNFTQIGKCSDVSSRHLLHSSHAHTLSDCQGQQEGVWVSLISSPFGILPLPIHISVWDDEKRPCSCFCPR